MAMAAFAIVLALAAACSSWTSGSTGPEDDGGALTVVATTNFAADWVENIGGDGVEIFSLVPVGADPHAVAPGARDVARVADADLVVSVGLGLEASWLSDLVVNAAADASRVVSLGEVADPIKGAGGNDLPNSGPFDPHFWLDPVRVKLAVSEVAMRLSSTRPENGAVYEENAAIYNRRLDDLHLWIKGQVAVIPSDRRLLVASHDSLRYFASRYGFEIVGTIMPGTTTEREPSAEELAALVRRMEELDASTVFGETTANERLAEAIVAETDARLVRLHTGSVGPPGSGAETYVEMMRTNVKLIVEALR